MAFMQQIEAACYEKTGSSQAFETMIDSFGTIPICFLMELEVIHLLDDLDRLNASTRHDFFPRLVIVFWILCHSAL